MPEPVSPSRAAPAAGTVNPEATHAPAAPSFTPVEQQALEHVWIHTARWLDLAERDGLRVLVRGQGSTV